MKVLALLLSLAACRVGDRAKVASVAGVVGGAIYAGTCTGCSRDIAIVGPAVGLGSAVFLWGFFEVIGLGVGLQTEQYMAEEHERHEEEERDRENAEDDRKFNEGLIDDMRKNREMLDRIHAGLPCEGCPSEEDIREDMGKIHDYIQGRESDRKSADEERRRVAAQERQQEEQQRAAADAKRAADADEAADAKRKADDARRAADNERRESADEQRAADEQKRQDDDTAKRDAADAKRIAAAAAEAEEEDKRKRESSAAAKKAAFASCMASIALETTASTGDGLGTAQGGLSSALRIVSQPECGSGKYGSVTGLIPKDCREKLIAVLENGSRGNRMMWVGEIKRVEQLAASVPGGPWIASKPACSSSPSNIEDLDTWCEAGVSYQNQCIGNLNGGIDATNCAQQLFHWAYRAKAAADYEQYKKDFEAKCRASSGYQD